jgi:hypothetical protein
MYLDRFDRIEPMCSVHPLDAQHVCALGATLVIKMPQHQQLSALSGESFADTSNSGGTPMN